MKITLEGTPEELLAILTPNQLKKLVGVGKAAIDTTGLTVKVEKDTEAIL